MERERGWGERGGMGVKGEEIEKREMGGREGGWGYRERKLKRGKWGEEGGRGYIGRGN